MRKVFSISLIVGVINAACTVAGGDAEDPSVSGSVVAALDASGAAPVAGAICTIEGTTLRGVTDANGAFTIPGVDPGTHIVICARTTADGRTFMVLQVVEVSRRGRTALGTLTATQPGSIAGVVSLNPITSLSGTTVSIPSTSYVATTGADGSFTLGNVPEGKYSLHLEHQGFHSIDVANVTVAAITTTTIPTMALDVSTGATGGLTFPGLTLTPDGTAVSGALTVNAQVAYSSDAVLMQFSDDPDFVGATWAPPVPSSSWTFTTPGLHHLYARFADDNGLASAPMAAAVIIDSTPPICSPDAGRCAYPSSPTSYRTRNINLAYFVTDPESGVVSADIGYQADFSDATNVPVTASEDDNDGELDQFNVDWTLPDADGTYTIYARFRNAANLPSTDAFVVTVGLDRVAPVATFTSLGPLDPATRLAPVTLASSERITSSACPPITFPNGGANLCFTPSNAPTVAPFNYTGSLRLFLNGAFTPPSGSYAFTLQVSDLAGNSSGVPGTLVVP